MAVAILFPSYDHPAIEERYASWQSEMLLRRDAQEIHRYDSDESGYHAVLDVDAPHVLVVTDPLLLPSPGLPDALAKVLEQLGTFAAVPVSNEAAHERQRATIPPYHTLRELEIESVSFRERESSIERVTWDRSDAGAFLLATSSVADLKTPLQGAIAGREVAIARGVFAHRWASLRGGMRGDLLDRVATNAKSILEFGCGEGALGEALKRRQKCRVVGIELDRRAAAIAKKRLDDVYQGDAREIISILHEKFDWIVGGDIVEHLDEPWSFLSELRRIAAPGCRLLLSLPNLAHGSVVADLLLGRFDYVYMGLTCAGHLRFFTRRTIEDMLTIAGWDVETIEAQSLASTREHERLIAQLQSASIPFSKEDLLPIGYYVIARKRQ